MIRNDSLWMGEGLTSQGRKYGSINHREDHAVTKRIDLLILKYSEPFTPFILTVEDVFGSKRNREPHNHLSTTNYAADVKMYSNSDSLNFRKGSRKQRTRFLYWATRMKQFETIVKIDSNSKDIQLPRKRNFSIQLSRFCVVDIEFSSLSAFEPDWYSLGFWNLEMPQSNTEEFCIKHCGIQRL